MRSRFLWISAAAASFASAPHLIAQARSHPAYLTAQNSVPECHASLEDAKLLQVQVVFRYCGTCVIRCFS